MITFSVLFTDYNVSFSGFYCICIYYTVWTLMFSIYLRTIETVFHWVWELFKVTACNILVCCM